MLGNVYDFPRFSCKEKSKRFTLKFLSISCLPFIVNKNPQLGDLLPAFVYQSPQMVENAGRVTGPR